MRSAVYIGIGIPGRAPLILGVAIRFTGLPRPDQLDGMTARAQAAHQARDGQRDPIELRGISLGYVSDMHGLSRFQSNGGARRWRNHGTVRAEQPSERSVPQRVHVRSARPIAYTSCA